MDEQLAYQKVDWLEYIMVQPKGKQKDVVLVVEMAVRSAVYLAVMLVSQ